MCMYTCLCISVLVFMCICGVCGDYVLCVCVCVLVVYMCIPVNQSVCAYVCTHTCVAAYVCVHMCVHTSV